MDGLSQKERVSRIERAKQCAVLDNSMESLLRQAEQIAGFIRYYNLNGVPEGSFDLFLQDLAEIRQKGVEHFIPDGNMEPAQALLYTFLRQLHETGMNFNNTWAAFLNWYIDSVLQVKAPRMRPDSAWIALKKHLTGNVTVPKGTRFTFGQADSENRILYRLMEDLTVSDITVEKLHTLYFEHHPHISPAKEFGCPTSLQVKDVLNDSGPGRMLFEPGRELALMQPLGLQISSPALLLREGKRIVSILFELEQIGISFAQKRLLAELRKRVKEPDPDLLFLKLMNNIFFLEISTAAGWIGIYKYALQNASGEKGAGLVLKFELPEAFPGTVPCDSGMHGITTGFPVLSIKLNRDAWLFPYVWLKTLRIVRIAIDTRVEGLSNILFYNDLGRVDISAPFAPFGINTERRAYFILGNYEMAVKNIGAVRVNIRWQQLPDNPGGLAEYYQGYEGENIDNTSFQLSSYCLKDYRWVPTAAPHTYYLFAGGENEKEDAPLPRHKLSAESCICPVRPGQMQPVKVTEEQYGYTLQAESGFINFVLESPPMGFGGKKYMQLFRKNILKNTVKKIKTELPNPPITPLIERITLSYTSHDEIRLLEQGSREQARLYHIYPFGTVKIYPNREHKPLPFIFSMPHDANLLFGLKNVKGDEVVSLYLDFFPHREEVSREEFPVVSWYWGNGYAWERLPDKLLLRDTTRNLVVNGVIRIYIPEAIPAGKLDAEGVLWLCAGIVKNETSISSVKNIYTNAGRVYREPDHIHLPRGAGFEINAIAEPVPGISEIQQIAPFTAGGDHEDGKEKLIRVSEYASHRGRAITARDYERMALQAFPQICKIKCLFREPGSHNPGKPVVKLVVIPYTSCGEDALRPKAGADLLLDVEAFFKGKTPGYVVVDAINPVYEEIMVRCSVVYSRTPHNRAYIRNSISQVINQVIAPWQYKNPEPVFGYSFPVKELITRIEKLKVIEKVETLSVVQFTQAEKESVQVKEYDCTGENAIRVTPVMPQGILVPVKEHFIKTITGKFGVEEMKINENFVIWPKETVKR